MNFTPKIKAGFVASGILAIAAVGWIGWPSRLAPRSEPIIAPQHAIAVQEAPWHPLPVAPAVEPLQGAAPQSAWPGYYYQPISSWYKNKHWWKRNAPIVGGAGGGALVGGLVGGGTGALVGGAVGGGGGYLYKRSRNHHHHYQYR